MNKDNWQTPKWLFNSLQNFFNVKYAVDLCATENDTLCKAFCSNIEEFSENDLLGHLGGDTNTFSPYLFYHNFLWNKNLSSLHAFCNPPYSDLNKILPCVLHAAKSFKSTTLILPVSTSSKWFSLIWDRDKSKPRKGFKLWFWPMASVTNGKASSRIRFINPDTGEEGKSPRNDTIIVRYVSK